MEHQLETHKNSLNGILEKKSKEIWARTVSVIEDYFDFMIMDILKGVYAELIRTTNFNQITNYLKKNYISFWKKFVISPIDNKLGWEYRQYFLKILNLIPEFDDVTKDFVLNTITQMGLEIQYLFIIKISPTEGVKCELSEEYLHYLENLINNYIQMTYFDHFILGQGLKVLFYTESYTFGEVYELRQKLNEFFRNFLHGLNDLAGFKIFIQKIGEQMPLSEYKMELISKILLAHFGTVIHNRGRSEKALLEELKSQIRKRNNLIKTNIGFQTPTNIDLIKNWISLQIDQILIYENNPAHEKNIIKKEIEPIFSQFIERKLDLKESLHLINKIMHSEIETNQEPPKNRYEALFDRISYEQEDIMGIEEQEYPHSTQELIKALLYMINESIEVDPSLENLIELIGQIQTENSPGEDGFYI